MTDRSGAPPVVRELVLLRAAEQINRLLENKKNIDEAIYTTVEAMRLVGGTWEQIGGALGMSKQAAQKRYRRADTAVQSILGQQPD